MNSENQIPNETKDTDHGCGHRGWKRGGRGRMFWKAPLILIFILVKGVAVFYLWNNLVPDIFHGPELTFLQAIGLMVLAKLLVGFHGGGFGRWGRHHHHHGHHGLHRRWHKMSDEERQKLRDKLRNKFGHHDER